MKKKDSLTHTFVTLCKIDSPTGEERKMVNFVLNYFKKIKIFAQKDKYGNVYARFGDKKLGIFLSAHLDTVEPGRRIKPQIKNGYIMSDGTTVLGADNKVAVTCILEAIKELVQKKLSHQTVEMVFTLSEEVGNYGAINFNYSLLQSTIGFCFDSSNPVGSIITASPYYERFDLEIIGRESHASKPDEAINVLPFIIKLFNKQKLGKIDRYSLFNIGVINGGYVRNTIPGKIILKGEIRSFFEKNLINIKQKFLNLLDLLAKKYQVKIQSDFVRENSGYFHQTNKNKEIIIKLKKIIKNLNLKPITMINWGVSDANIFNDKKLMTFNLGDGSEFAHSKKERIKISDMVTLKNVILNLTQNYDLG